AAAIMGGKLAPPPQFLATLRQRHGAWSSIADDAALLDAARLSLEQWCVSVQRDETFAPVPAHSWSAFRQPAKTDFQHLVHHPEMQRDGYKAWSAEADHRRRRDGFSLTDPRFPLRRVMYEIDHCIYCHDRDADSCSKGMRQKDGFKTNAL